MRLLKILLATQVIALGTCVAALIILLSGCTTYKCYPSKRSKDYAYYPPCKTLTVVLVKNGFAFARWKDELYKGPADTLKKGDKICAIPGDPKQNGAFVIIG